MVSEELGITYHSLRTRMGIVSKDLKNSTGREKEEALAHSLNMSTKELDRLNQKITKRQYYEEDDAEWYSKLKYIGRVWNNPLG
jgi:hypothetical protein